MKKVKALLTQSGQIHEIDYDERMRLHTSTMTLSTFNLLVRRVNRGYNVHIIVEPENVVHMIDYLTNKLGTFSNVLVFESYTSDGQASILVCTVDTDADSFECVMKLHNSIVLVDDKNFTAQDLYDWANSHNVDTQDIMNNLFFNLTGTASPSGYTIILRDDLKKMKHTWESFFQWWTEK